MYWFTADTHFGHENILKYTNRDYKSVEDMDKDLINKWNSRVKPEDTVFFLGDFSMSNLYKPKYYLKKLNGKIIWIKGNHDKTPIVQDMLIHHGGRYFHLTHDPKDSEGEYNLHGHVHTLWKIKKEKGKVYINVGVDQWGGYPINITEISKEIENGIHKD